MRYSISEQLVRQSVVPMACTIAPEMTIAQWRCQRALAALQHRDGLAVSGTTRSFRRLPVARTCGPAARWASARVSASSSKMRSPVYKVSPASCLIVTEANGALHE